MYWKRRYFVLNCELYGKIWSINTTCEKIVSAVLMKKWVLYILDKCIKGMVDTKQSKRGSTILVNIEEKGCTLKFRYERN